jgi:hypothetical protein
MYIPDPPVHVTYDDNFAAAAEKKVDHHEVAVATIELCNAIYLSLRHYNYIQQS